MHCPACGRVVADNLRLCNYCGEPLAARKPTAKPPAKKPASSALGKNPQKAFFTMYRLIAVIGVIVVFFEMVRMVTFAVNVLAMIIQGQIDASIFGSVLSLPLFIAIPQAILYYAILIGVAVSMFLTSSSLTIPRDRTLCVASGVLTIVIALLEIFSVPLKLGVSAMTLLLLALIPFLVFCVLHRRPHPSSIGFLITCSLIPLFELLFPPVFKAIMNALGEATSLSEFLPLLNPIFYLVFIAAYTLPTCYAFSFFSQYFNELSETYRIPKSPKSAAVKK